MNGGDLPARQAGASRRFGRRIEAGRSPEFGGDLPARQAGASRRFGRRIKAGRSPEFSGDLPARQAGASRRFDRRIKAGRSPEFSGDLPARQAGASRRFGRRIKIGVLALQGAFAAHQARLAELGVETPAVRQPEDVHAIDALVLPGGESTTMSKLLASTGLFDEIKALVSDGLPVFGTCAGMILLATEVLDGRPDQHSFGALDVTVRRNGYGRQIDSFEADLDVDGLDGDAFHAVFIRAPVVESTGPGVATLAEHDGRPVVIAQGAIMAASFHPELVADNRLHRRFLDLL